MLVEIVEDYIHEKSMRIVGFVGFAEHF